MEKLKPLEKLASSRFISVPEGHGIYAVFWARNGEFVPIPRILGTDERGILYIGTTRGGKKRGRSKEKGRGLRERLRDLWISVQSAYDPGKRSFPHTFGKSLVYTGLYKVINVKELEIYFKELNKGEADYYEKLMLSEYTRKYGELPPLNLQVGREYFLTLGLGKLGRSRLRGELEAELRSVLGL